MTLCGPCEPLVNFVVNTNPIRGRQAGRQSGRYIFGTFSLHFWNIFRHKKLIIK
jgi:hypothetical protein